MLSGVAPDGGAEVSALDAGGVLAGDSVARLAVAYGWNGVFVTLATVSAVAALCAGALHLLNTRAVTEVLHA